MHLHIGRSWKHQLAQRMLLINRSCQTEHSRSHLMPYPCFMNTHIINMYNRKCPLMVSSPVTAEISFWVSVQSSSDVHRAVWCSGIRSEPTFASMKPNKRSDIQLQWSLNIRLFSHDWSKMQPIRVTWEVQEIFQLHCTSICSTNLSSLSLSLIWSFSHRGGGRLCTILIFALCVCSAYLWYIAGSACRMTQGLFIL